jgi:hypothetical protein
MQEKYPDIKISNVRGAVVELSRNISGGTVNSGFNIIESFSKAEIKQSMDPFCLSAVKPASHPPEKSIFWDDRLGGWVGPWIMGATNAANVCHTYGLLGGQWGPHFRYHEYICHTSWLRAQVMTISLTVLSFCALFAPFRWLVRKVLPAGTGPSEEALRNSKFCMKIVAESEDNKSGSITISSDTDVGYVLAGMPL